MRARSPLTFLSAVLGCYFALEALIASRMPIFFDEGLFVSEAQLLSDHLTRRNAFLAIADNHGPLQRWIIAAFIHVGAPGLVAGRVLSVLAGAVTIVAVFGIARRISDEAARFAAAAAALMPALAVHSSLAIVDPLAVAAISMATLLALRHAEEPSWKRGAELAAAVAVAVLAKKTGLLALVLVAVSASTLLASRGRERARWRDWSAGAALAVVGALAALAVGKAAPRDEVQFGDKVANHTYRGIGDVLSDFPAQIGPGVRTFGGDLVSYATPALLVIALAGIVFLALRRRDLAWLVGVWAVLPLVVAILSARAVYPRYVLAAYPALAVLSGAGMAALRSEAGLRRVRRPVRTAICVAALIPAAIFDIGTASSPASKHYPGVDDWQYVSGWPAGTLWPRVSEVLERRAAQLHLRTVGVAFGGVTVGPIGLAAEIGHPTVAEGVLNAGLFSASAHGRTYIFEPYSALPDAPFVVGQDPNLYPPPLSLTRRYRPIFVAKRPHRGSVVILYARR